MASEGLFNALSNPSYQEGLMTVAAQLGSAQATAQAAERQKEIDSMSFKLLRQGLFSADQGDVSALAARTNDLVDMMGRTTDEKSRATLQDMITQLDAQRSATQTKATSNTASSIIKTEQALMDLQNEMDSTAGPLAPERQRVFDALTQRLEYMKSTNPTAVVEAESIKYNTEVDAITKAEALRTLKIDAAVRDLQNLPVGSPQRAALEKKLEAENLGIAIDKVVQQEQEAEQRERELQIIRGKTGELSPEEIEDAKQYGIWEQIKDLPVERKRFLFNAAAVKDTELRTSISLQPLTVPEQARARALITRELNAIARSGDYVDLLPWHDDIKTKIDGLNDDQLAELLGRTAGLAEIQIQQEVVNWLYENFEEEMKNSDQYRKNIAEKNERFNELVQQIFKDDPTLDPANPDDMAVAKRRADRAIDEAKSLSAPSMGGRSGADRRERRGKVEVAEPYDVFAGRKPGTGGQMSRRQR